MALRHLNLNLWHSDSLKFEYTDVEPSNIEYGECVTSILDAVNSKLRALRPCNIEYELQKASQNDKKTRNFEYKVLEKPVYSNIRGPSSRNFANSIPIIFQGISVLRPSFLAIHAKLAKKNISTFWGFEPGTNFCKNSNPGPNFAAAIVAINPSDHNVGRRRTTRACGG